MKQSSAPNSLSRQANVGSVTEPSSCLIWMGLVKAEGLSGQTPLGCPPTGRRQRGAAACLAGFAPGALAAGLQLGQIATWGRKLEGRQHLTLEGGQGAELAEARTIDKGQFSGCQWSKSSQNPVG